MKYLMIMMLMAFSSQVFAQEATWLTDYDAAIEQGNAEDKLVLLSFSGSDWCGNCMRLDQELFQSEVFIAYANEHLILVNADFPAKKANKLSKEQTEHNDALAEKFNKQGIFPLSLLIDGNGNIVAKLATACSDPNRCIQEIKLNSAQ